MGPIESTVFRGGWVLDEDGATRQQVDVRVEGALITAVGEHLDVGDARVVDCAGSTVMPGLIDAHVHLAMAGSPEPDSSPQQSGTRVAGNARELLAAGVTTVRDASGPSGVLLEQRARCADDPIAGPQILLCCEGIACVDGHGTEFRGANIVTEIDGPESARAAVRRLGAIGADWVKVMLNGANDEIELGEQELRAIVDEARGLQLPVAAHASNPKAVALAVRCGVDSIEHGNGIDDELATAMAETGMALVTTTHVYRAGAGCAGGHDAGDPLVAFEPRVREQVRSIMATRVAAHERAIPAVLGAGARIVLGTDAVTGPIGLVAEELIALTTIGMSPAQALRAATVAGAELLGLPDRGRVAVGLRADLLVVAGRPDEDVSTIAKPELVMRGGVVATLAGED
jgi:imidazolonepropionase-like amidohydrolase